MKFIIIDGKSKKLAGELCMTIRTDLVGCISATSSNFQFPRKKRFANLNFATFFSSQSIFIMLAKLTKILAKNNWIFNGNLGKK